MKSIPIEGDMSALGRGEQADAAQAQGVENLCPKTVATKIHAHGFEDASIVIDRSTLGDAETGTGVRHVDKRAFPLLGDLLQGEVDTALLPRGVAIEDITEDILGLNPDQSG